MTSLITDEIRAKASELYTGHEVCKPQTRRLFAEMHFPNGLLPLQDIEEVGYIEETGFVWLKMKKEIEHKFEKIDRLVRYGTEITATVEPCKISNLTGVQAKEVIILWITINEITVESPESETIVFKNHTTGIERSFPVDAFVVEDTEPAVEAKKVVDATVDATPTPTPVEVKEV